MGVSYARVTNTTRPVAKVHPRFGLRGDTLGHTTHLIQVQECIFDLQLPQLLAGGRPGIHTVQTGRSVRVVADQLSSCGRRN